MSTRLDAEAPEQLHQLAYPIAQLHHDPKNARVHDERNIAAVKASLQKFGWRGIIVVRKTDNVILVGNARVMAARSLGWTQAPVLFVDEAGSAKYAIADNRSAELATWDVEALLSELATLKDLDGDEDLSAALGFTVEEIAELEKDVGWTDDEAEVEGDDADQPDASPAVTVTEVHQSATPSAASVAVSIMQVRVEFNDELWARWKAALARASERDSDATPSELALRAMKKVFA